MVLKTVYNDYKQSSLSFFIYYGHTNLPTVPPNRLGMDFTRGLCLHLLFYLIYISQNISFSHYPTVHHCYEKLRCQKDIKKKTNYHLFILEKNHASWIPKKKKKELTQLCKITEETENNMKVQ